jgi:hypothetical protein
MTIRRQREGALYFPGRLPSFLWYILPTWCPFVVSRARKDRHLRDFKAIDFCPVWKTVSIVPL